MSDGTVMVSVGRHRLAATVFGEGTPPVIIEPSFGGCAEDWQRIAQTLAEETMVVTYDRAPYGASSAARDARTPRDIAGDLDGVLRELGVTGPVVLVGHSAGGLYIRAYAAEHPDRVAGMVLVESSHEGQRPVLDPLRSRKIRLATALAIPSIMLESLHSRRGGDRRSIIREWRTFHRVTAGSPALPPGELGDRPLVVLTCAPGAPGVSDRVWQAWHDLHSDLTRLSVNRRHVVSDSPSHYLNADDPDLVISAIRDVVRSARDGAPLSAGSEAARTSPDTRPMAETAIARGRASGPPGGKPPYPSYPSEADGRFAGVSATSDAE
jgi:pimeloyl-ACP methyl ester carboxylesterase